MILGSCPYEDCNGPVCLPMPPDEVRLPAYLKHTCEDCQRTIWTKITRVDPTSWTEEDFLKEYIVDGRQITERNPPLF